MALAGWCRLSKPEPLSAQELSSLAAEHGSWVAVARHLGRPTSTIRDRAHRLGLDIRKLAPKQAKAAQALTPGVVIKGDSATVVSAPSPQMGDVEQVLRDRGLDVNEWDVRGLTVNEWDAQGPEGEVITLRQLKITLARRTPIEFLFPAVDVKPRKPGKPPKKLAGQARTVIALGDQHCPLVDEQLHQAVLRFIGPGGLPHDEIVCLGDVGDYPAISRFRDSGARKWMATAQECIQSSFEYLVSVREASPDARLVVLKGNHDWRIETELAARAERLSGLTPAELPGIEQIPAYSLRHLLHMDTIGCELVEPDILGDDYNHAEHWLSDQLVCIHGKSVKNGAEKHAESIGASVIMGHTHKQRHTVVSRWVHDGQGDQLKHLDAVEAGTLRELGTSVGYANRPRSQQGFAVATILPDGSHTIELAAWVDGQLLFRGERW